MTEADLAGAVRAAVQAVLDAAGDGWHCAQMVVCMGLERFNSDGELESIPWVWWPPTQPDWMALGLIESAVELRRDVDDE